MPTAQIDVSDARPQLSLGVKAARQLSHTTKSAPQMREITPRWLSRFLPWFDISGGVFRVNRRLVYAFGDGRVSFTSSNGVVNVVPRELREISWLSGYDDIDVLTELASGFEQVAFEPDEVIVEQGRPADRLILIAQGKLAKIGTGPYGDETMLGVLAEGDYLSPPSLETPGNWTFAARAISRCNALVLPVSQVQRAAEQSDSLLEHFEAIRRRGEKPQNKQGEAAVELSAGHEGEVDIPGTFVDYDTHPREYHLSVAQTILRIHTRVSDLYNGPYDQTREQIRLTIEAVRERQEWELINNRDFGLLHNAEAKQRIKPRLGPPTPDDLDELLTRRRNSKLLVAHPKTIAAFGRQCTRRGMTPGTVERNGGRFVAWRGVPILPCDKIPISTAHTSSILVIRPGLEDQGVVGLRQTGIPDEYEPGLSVKFMDISSKSIASYLVTAYYSVAVMVPDAIGVLEDVEIAR